MCLEISKAASSSLLGMLPYTFEFNGLNFSYIQNITSSLVKLRGLCSLLLLKSTFLLAHKGAHFQNLSVCAHLDDLIRTAVT